MYSLNLDGNSAHLGVLGDQSNVGCDNWISESVEV